MEMEMQRELEATRGRTLPCHWAQIVDYACVPRETQVPCRPHGTESRGVGLHVGAPTIRCEVL